MGISEEKSTTERVYALIAAGQSQAAVDLCRDVCQTPAATPQDWL